MSETLTVEKFVAWKKAGLLNKAIANKVGKSPSNLSSWAAYHSKKIDVEMAKQHKKPGPKTGQTVSTDTASAETDSQKDRRIAALIKDKSELINKLNDAEEKLTEMQNTFDVESARSEADAHKKVDKLQKQLNDALKKIEQGRRIHDDDLKSLNKYAQLLEALELFVYHSLESELDV